MLISQLLVASQIVHKCVTCGIRLEIGTFLLKASYLNCLGFQVGSVIRDPEIAALVPTLPISIADPNEHTKTSLDLFSQVTLQT